MRPHRQQPTRLPIPRILQARTLEWVAISFCNAWKWKVKVKSLSHVRLFATPWTGAYHAVRTWDFPGKSTGVGCHRLLHMLCYYRSNTWESRLRIGWRLPQEGEIPLGLMTHLSQEQFPEKICMHEAWHSISSYKELVLRSLREIWMVHQISIINAKVLDCIHRIIGNNWTVEIILLDLICKLNIVGSILDHALLWTRAVFLFKNKTTCSYSRRIKQELNKNWILVQFFLLVSLRMYHRGWIGWFNKIIHSISL